MGPEDTPDGRPGAAILIFARSVEALTRAVRQRVGQCLLTCPTTAVFNGGTGTSGDGESIDVGRYLSFFGGGFESDVTVHSRACWCIPVMDGQFTVEEVLTAVSGVGGGNFLVCGSDPPGVLAAAMRAAQAIRPLPGVITPFPGGICRSGSKVGSRHEGVIASTNDAYCPTLREQTQSKLSEAVNCVYEIVIDGLSQPVVEEAMRVGIRTACESGPGGKPQITAISAGNYGGALGKIRFELHDLARSTED